MEHRKNHTVERKTTGTMRVENDEKKSLRNRLDQRIRMIQVQTIADETIDK